MRNAAVMVMGLGLVLIGIGWLAARARHPITMPLLEEASTMQDRLTAPDFPEGWNGSIPTDR